MSVGLGLLLFFFSARERAIDGYMYMHGYSGDKPPFSQMFRGGVFNANLNAEDRHDIDAVPGDSGACFYGGVAIENRCRRWDSATYNFFDAYASMWP